VKPVRFHGAWIIRAPRDRVYTLMMDFERWPELFPEMVEAIRVVSRNDKTAVLEGDFNLVGRRGHGVMNIRLRPPSGYDADNTSEELGNEKESLWFEVIPEGTLFKWEVIAEPKGVWTRLLARLLGFYVRRFYKRTLIRPLRNAVED
jgi:hypothetical protein